MLFSLFFIILAYVLMALSLNKKKHLIKHGHFVRSKTLHIDTHDFYVEEVRFKDYQDALHQYYKIVNDVAKRGNLLAVEYDLYNWTYAILQFQDCTIELRHHRSYNKIQLIKSETSLSIETYLTINPQLKP